MRASEIRKLDFSEMCVKLRSLRKDILSLALSKNINKEEMSNGKLKMLKKNVARVKTVINERRCNG